MLDWFLGGFDTVHQWAFEHLTQPLLYQAGLGGLVETGYAGTGWFLVGLLQLLVIVLVIGLLQRWRPVEPVTDISAVRTDIWYTVLHRLGLFRVGLFFLLDPLSDGVFGWLRVAGVNTFQLESLWPSVMEVPWVALVVYLVIFDFVDYWVHRAQHQWEWWWRLHALHHSQRQMTMWSDNRNHLLDDVLRDTIFVVLAQAIGVPPGQFIAVVALTKLSESFQHANLRVWFGVLGERLWISPRFHRRHHSIGVGHETVQRVADGPIAASRVVLGGCNFGVLLPWWDMMFGTADFLLRFDPTGIRDQVEPDATGRLRDYGRGFWSQQWMGLLRLVGRG